MPKIPTFTTEARPTAEVGSIKTNIQIPLSQTIGTALAPITKAVVDYKVKEKGVENKTEALELENKSVLELNDVAQKASSLYKNSDQANNYLMQESKIIIDKYAALASNNTVKTMFKNSYLLEEQKKIFSVDNAVYKNLIQSRAIASEQKETNILTDALYGNNELAKKELPTDLSKIYTDDYNDGLIDIDTYEAKIASIPNTIGYFEVQKDISNDPVQTYVNLNTGKYEGLTLKTREELKRDAKLEATPILKDNIKNYIKALENGEKININKEAIKELFGAKVYTDFIETENNTLKLSTVKSAIFNSKEGEEQAILDSWNLNSKNYAQDLEYKNKARNFISEKNELIAEDAATLIIQHNSTVRQLFENYQNEPETSENKEKFFQKYINSVVQAQEDMNIDPSFIKVIPNNFAEKLVRDYESQEPLAKITYLQGLENQYGEQYGRVLSQLSDKGLPITAKLVSYLGDENFAIEAMSIDTKDEKNRLDKFLKNSDIQKFTISMDVFDKMKPLRDVVMYGNKMNTTKANKEMNDIQEIISYIAINKMSSGTTQKDAIQQATDAVMTKFKFAGGESMLGGKNTYFIPKRYNNKNLSAGQMNLIEAKATAIKENHLKDFNMFSFQSENPDIDDQEINDEMLIQAKENGVWVNNSDGSGIVFAIPFPDGSLALVENQKGELLQLNFDDGSHVVPTTDFLINLKIYDTNKIEDITP